MTKVMGQCDICHEPISAFDQGNYKRKLGYHKRIHHGIVGATSTPAGKRSLARKRHWRLQGLSPRQVEEREHQFLLKHPESGRNEDNGQSEPVIRKKKPTEEVTPVGLKECPNCGCRFYMARSNSEKEP